LITSQIRSRIGYLIPSYIITVLLVHSNLILKFSLIDGFSIRFDDTKEVTYFLLAHPVYSFYCDGLLMCVAAE